MFMKQELQGSSADEWIKKLWYIYTVEYQGVTKDEIVSSA